MSAFPHHRRVHLRPGVNTLLVIALLVAAPSAVGAASKQTPRVPEQVMAELSAANAARAARLREQQAWALEKQRLGLLQGAVEAETKRLADAAAEARRQAVDLRKRVAVAQARQKRLESVEAMVDALAERLEKALETLAVATLPGVVPLDKAAGITDPAARLAAAVQRISDAEQRAREPGIELVTGTLAGQPATVKLLRIGGVAGWWMTLDCERTGTAVVQDGKLVLHPAGMLDDAVAIKKAFSIAEGRAAPHWVLLPLRRRTDTQAEAKP